MKKRKEGWAIEESDGSVTFYTRLPNHITTANPFHMYRAVLTYGTTEKTKGKVTNERNTHTRSNAGA